MSSFAMAGRGPKARYYPGANSLAIFSAQGSNPLQDCKVFGKGVTKVYDKSVKGYVYNISGGLQSKLQLPKDDSKIGLQLLQPFLVLQVFVPQGVHFSVELRVSDINSTRRKMYFSTSFSEIKSTPLHCQIPISMVVRNKWLSLAFHVADLFNHCFRGGGGMNFRSIDVIVLGPICKLRKMFTMRCPITKPDPGGHLEVYNEEPSENSLPQEHTYALGVDTCVQTLDMVSLQSALAGNNESHHDDDSRLGQESARKAGGKPNQQGKGIENIRSVHVAFGTRMPLPLSTVHINTNLPHDKYPTLVKDRIGSVHFVSGPTAGGGGGGDINKPPGNMVSRALSVASLDRERRNNVDINGESKLMMKTNRTGYASISCGEEKEQVTNTPHLIMIDGNSTGGDCGAGEPIVGASEDFQIPSASQDPIACPESPKLTANVSPMVVESHGGGGGVETSTSTTASNKSPTKWAPRKKDVQLSTTQLRQQKSKDQRSKDYKNPRYMDSPPGSPPCGWDHNISSAGGRTTQLGDIVFHDHFLEGSWMNSQLSESMDEGNKPYCLANSLKEKILSSMPHSLSTRLDEEAVMMVDAMNNQGDQSKSIKTLHDQFHQISQSFEWASSSTSSKSVHRDTDQGFNGKEFEPTFASYGDYYSEGQHSWSSKSSSVPFGDHAVHEFEPSFLSRGTSAAVADAAHNAKLGEGAQTSKQPDLQSCLQSPTSPLLAKEYKKRSQNGDDSLMLDIHDARFFPGHQSSLITKDFNGLETHAMQESLFSPIQGKGAGESFDFDGEQYGCQKQDSSPQDTLHESTTSMFTLDPTTRVQKSDKMSSSWQETNPCERHSCHVSSGLSQLLVDRELEGHVKSNGRPDEDLDLLYDPTLDCYYDPKTNRYYELK